MSLKPVFHPVSANEAHFASSWLNERFKLLKEDHFCETDKPEFPGILLRAASSIPALPLSFAMLNCPHRSKQQAGLE